MSPNLPGVVLAFGAVMTLTWAIAPIISDMQKRGMDDFAAWLAQQSVETILRLQAMVASALAMLGAGICMSLWRY